MQKSKFFAILLASVVMALPAPSAQAEKVGVWVGGQFRENSYYTYLGGMSGFGQDLASESGFVTSIHLGFGQFDYNTVAVPGGNVDADQYSGDMMVGYRHNFGSGHITAQIGGEYKNYDLSPPNPLSQNDGAEWGVKGSLDISSRFTTNTPFGISGSYSSAFESYRTAADIGYDFGPVTLGPIGVIQGNQDWHQWKAGALLSNIDLGFAKAKLDVGYFDTTDRGGDDGIYGGVGFSKGF